MNKKPYLESVFNTITFVFALWANYWFNAGGFNNTSISDISEKYENLFTPSDYAFAIWGLIYVSLAFFIANQWYSIASKSKEPVRTGPWLAITNLLNAAWVYVWVSDMPGWSVVIMFLLLLSLLSLVLKLNMEKWDAPVSTIALVWWPIDLYFGWITLATVTNVSAYLVSTGWYGGTLGEIVWTQLMIGVAAVIFLFLIVFRNMREAAAVGIWGLVGIVVRHWGNYDNLVLMGIAGIAIIATVSGIHAYKNRDTLPHKKMARGEV